MRKTTAWSGLKIRALRTLGTALLSGTPNSRGAGAAPFVLDNPDSIKLFPYYTEHHNLWQRGRQVQAAEINNLLEALKGDALAETAGVRQPLGTLNHSSKSTRA